MDGIKNLAIVAKKFCKQSDLSEMNTMNNKRICNSYAETTWVSSKR